MSIFYDPKTKKPKLWIFIVFIIIPIVIFILAWNIGKTMFNQKTTETAVEEDIFQKF